VKRSTLVVVATSATAIVLVGGTAAYAVSHHHSASGDSVSLSAEMGPSRPGLPTPTVDGASPSAAASDAPSETPSPDPTAPSTAPAHVTRKDPAPRSGAATPTPGHTSVPVTASTSAGPVTDTTVHVTNSSGLAVTLELDGHAYALAASAQKTVQFQSDSSGDSILVKTNTDPPCGMGSGGNYFMGGGTYTVSVVIASSFTCQVDGSSVPAPTWVVNGPNGYSGGG
jgi:hypothetical protein